MDPIQELLASDHQQTLQFFIAGLQDVSDPGVDQQELLYNASVLAHYAQVSVHAGPWPTPAGLAAVFDQFVCATGLVRDGETMEVAGTQCLVMSGFFEDQMRERHNVRWYAALGAGFLSEAAVLERSSPKARLLEAIATRFDDWRRRQARLSRALRDQPYVLPRGNP